MRFNGTHPLGSKVDIVCLVCDCLEMRKRPNCPSKSGSHTRFHEPFKKEKLKDGCQAK